MSTTGPRSGKSYGADLIVKMLAEKGIVAQRISLAAALKRFTGELLDYLVAERPTDPDLFKKSNCGIMVETPLGDNFLSGRDLLVAMGEAARKSFGSKFWIERLEAHVVPVARLSTDPTVFVVDDIRYDNEARWVINSGGFITNIYGAVKRDDSGDVDLKADYLQPSNGNLVEVYNKMDTEDFQQRLSQDVVGKIVRRLTNDETILRQPQV